MHGRVARAAGFLTFVLLAASLVCLQVVDSERDLLPFLAIYAAVALAVIIAAAARDLSATSASWWCLASTIGFAGYIIVRAVVSPVAYTARADLYLALTALCVYALTVTSLERPGQRLALVVVLLLAALAQVVIGVTQVIRGGSLSMLIPVLESLEHGRVAGRGAGLYAGPSHLAGMLEVVGALGLGIACWSRRSATVRVCVGYLAAACYVGIAFSGSRGGYLAATASILVFVLLSVAVLAAAGRPQLLKFGTVGLAVGSLLVVGLWTLLEQTTTFTSNLERLLVDPGRVDLWRAAIEQWKVQPWTGTGSGTYLFYGREFREPTMQNDPVNVHNDYLHLLAEYGVVGAVAFLLFFFAHVWRGWLTFVALGWRRVAAGAPPLSDRLALTIGALSVLAAYVVHSAVDYNLHIPSNALLVACVVGIIAAPGPIHEQTTTSAVRRLATRLAVGVPAAVLLVQCLRFIPGEYFADRARVALWDEDPAAAAEYALEALKYEQQNPNIYFYLGRSLRASAGETSQPEEQASLYETAIKAQAKAQRLAPLDATFPLEQAMLYDKLARFEEAEAMFAAATARDPHAVYIAREYRAHQELWEKSRTQPAPPAPVQPEPDVR